MLFILPFSANIRLFDQLFYGVCVCGGGCLQQKEWKVAFVSFLFSFQSVGQLCTFLNILIRADYCVKKTKIKR